MNTKLYNKIPSCTLVKKKTLFLRPTIYHLFLTTNKLVNKILNPILIQDIDFTNKKFL